MEPDLLEYIIQTETLSSEMKDMFSGMIRFKMKIIIALKFIVILHLISIATILISYPTFWNFNNTLGNIMMIVNVVINIALLNSIRIRSLLLERLKSKF